MKPFVFAIRAEYARRILDGSKRWEFRTRMPRVTMGDIALIYESRGRGRIVAAFTVDGLIHPMSPARLWALVTELGGGHGIDWPAFSLYFDGRETGIAIGVGSPIPLDLELPPGMSPPQSWVRWRGAWPLGDGS